MINAIEKYNIDIIMLNETNCKQNKNNTNKSKVNLQQHKKTHM